MTVKYAPWTMSTRISFTPRLFTRSHGGDEHVTIKRFAGNGRAELLHKQLKDRTTRTAELKLVIVGPPSSAPTTPPHPITWITATTLHCLGNKRCFEVMLLFFVPTTAAEQRENRAAHDKDNLRAAYNERTSIIGENTHAISKESLPRCSNKLASGGHNILGNSSTSWNYLGSFIKIKSLDFPHQTG